MLAVGCFDLPLKSANMGYYSLGGEMLEKTLHKWLDLPVGIGIGVLRLAGVAVYEKYHPKPPRHFTVFTGYTAHKINPLIAAGEICTGGNTTQTTCSWVPPEQGHQWQSRSTGVVCGTTVPEPDGEWGFVEMDKDAPSVVEFDTEKEAFDFGSQWCKP